MRARRGREPTQTEFVRTQIAAEVHGTLPVRRLRASHPRDGLPRDETTASLG